jgi:hypothetical protein
MIERSRMYDPIHALGLPEDVLPDEDMAMLERSIANAKAAVTQRAALLDIQPELIEERLRDIEKAARIDPNLRAPIFAILNSSIQSGHSRVTWNQLHLSPHSFKVDENQPPEAQIQRKIFNEALLTQTLCHEFFHAVCDSEVRLKKTPDATTSFWQGLVVRLAKRAGVTVPLRKRTTGYVAITGYQVRSRNVEGEEQRKHRFEAADEMAIEGLANEASDEIIDTIVSEQGQKLDVRRRKQFERVLSADLKKRIESYTLEGKMLNAIATGFAEYLVQLGDPKRGDAKLFSSLENSSRFHTAVMLVKKRSNFQAVKKQCRDVVLKGCLQKDHKTLGIVDRIFGPGTLRVLACIPSTARIQEQWDGTPAEFEKLLIGACFNRNQKDAERAQARSKVLSKIKEAQPITDDEI